MWSKIINALSKLQLITFAILLGAGVVVTGLSAWIIYIIGYFAWPEAVASERVHSLAIGLWILLGLVGLVVVSLAFGKVEKISVSGATISGALEFDHDDDDEKKDEVAPEKPE